MKVGNADDPSSHLAICAVIDPEARGDIAHRVKHLGILDAVATPATAGCRSSQRELVASALRVSRRVAHVLVIESGLQLSPASKIFSTRECLNEDSLAFLRFADAATVLASREQTIDVVFLGYARGHLLDDSVWSRRLFYTYADTHPGAAATLPAPPTGRYIEWRAMKLDGPLCYLITAAAAAIWLADPQAVNVPAADYLCEKFRTFSIEAAMRCRPMG